MTSSDDVVTTPETTPETITAWCREYLAGLMDVPADRIDPSTDLDRLGIDSALAVSLLMEIEGRYGVDLPPEALFDDPTLDAVAARVHERLAHP